MNPRFVIFDEPTCGLDAEGVCRFIQIADHLKATGVGLVVISHDGDLINRLCEHVLHLKSGGGWNLYHSKEFFAAQMRQNVVSQPVFTNDR
jgi:energy-coupling factor transporter ATP-binding protein EcfA2